MVRPKVQFQNNGRTKTTYTVNFEDSQSILDIITPLMANSRIKKEIMKLGMGILEHVHKDDGIEGGIEQVTKLLQCLSPSEENPVDVNFMLKTFGSFLSDLPIDQQLIMYKLLGEQLNLPLQEQSDETPKLENVDLSQLLKSSGKDLYDAADPRLKVFIEEATKTAKTENYGSDMAKSKKASFCQNIVENFLKARNLRFVSLSGLSLLTLVYIFSGRSIQTCKLFSATGAKGTYNLVMKYVLPNSRKTSYKSCVDNVTVFYSFDNMQKLAKIWRLHGSQQTKSLANVVTSIVHCYPDGLLSTNVQYVLRHSPMLWLYKFEHNEENGYILEKFDGKIVEKIMKLSEEDMDIVLGRWDLTIEKAIDEVKKEIFNGKDAVDKIIEKRKEDEERNVRYCENGHRNEKPRANQKNCRSCKRALIDVDSVENIYVEDMDDTSGHFNKNYKKLKVMDNEAGPIEVCLVEADKKTKAKLYPQVRNIYNENRPIYRSQGTVFVNPNTFIRVKMVLEEIQKLTKTGDKQTKLIRIEEDGSITVQVNEVKNVRSWILVTLDGLPHKIAIDVIKHCFRCEECGKEFTVNNDVTKHYQSVGHKLYWKKFGNIILKIGGLHAEMNMLRSFVSLNWPIYYSFLCKSIGFRSPKAQLLQQKVQDMHKSWDTFHTVRDAVVREVVKLFVDFTDKNSIVASAETFESWLEEKVKNPNIKLLVEIQKYFGTSIWLYRAGMRANYHKLYRAGIRVFAGLFHINGNLHYSAIEVFDDYLMTSLEHKNTELFEHVIKRLCTNVKEEPYCAQSHDARHEESNKLAQNMFAGKDLDELDLAFTIVDDVYELRKKVFDENGIKDRSEDLNIVVPEYHRNTSIMRSDLRESILLSEPYADKPLQSIDGHSLHTDLLDVFKISQLRREADIRNAYRFNDFCQAYNPKSKLAIFENDREYSKTEKEIKEEILIMIHLIEDDLEVQIAVREMFEKVKGKDKEELANFLDRLVEKEYQTLYESYK